MRLLSPTERTGPVGCGTFVLGRFAGEPMFELPLAPLLIAPPPFEPTPAGGRGTDLCGVLAKPPLLRANPPLFAFAPTLPRLFPAKPPPHALLLRIHRETQPSNLTSEAAECSVPSAFRQIQAAAPLILTDRWLRVLPSRRCSCGELQSTLR